MLPLLITIFITILDQATKLWVREEFALYESRQLIENFFYYTHVRNPGAAWGLFGGHNTFLTVLSVVMLFAIFVFRRSFLSDTWEHRVALGLMGLGPAQTGPVVRAEAFIVEDADGNPRAMLSLVEAGPVLLMPDADNRHAELSVIDRKSGLLLYDVDGNPVWAAP